jgi:hypothetical protein
VTVQGGDPDVVDASRPDRLVDDALAEFAIDI